MSESAEWTLCGLKISSFPLNKEVQPSFFSDVGFDPDDLKVTTVRSGHHNEENGRRVEVRFYNSTNFGDKTPLEFFQQICLELGLYISDAKTYSESTVISLKKKR